MNFQYHYTGSIAITDSGVYGQGTGPIHAAGVQCTGSEPSLFVCPSSSSASCDHSMDAAVQCRAAGN